jgi:hypothetical protein
VKIPSPSLLATETIKVFKNMSRLSSRLFSNRSVKEVYNEIPKDRFRYITRHPWAVRKLVSVSLEQDQEGSHYHGILNTIANDCIGPCPIIIGQTPEYVVNIDIEQQWLKFCQLNEIGKSFRLLRRAAAKTGVAIGIPYKITHDFADDVKLGLKVLSSERLQNPPISRLLDENIYEGIKYDENWNPERIWVDTGEEFEVNKILLWWKQKDEALLRGIPECSPALCIFPSVQRYLTALVRSAEFKSCIPIVVKLDPHVWGKSDAIADGVPSGMWEMEPGQIPTLPPGTSLESLSNSGTSAEDINAIDAMVGSAARCVNMPLNLAIGNSAKLNMAASQVDLGPWKNTVKIDREDFSVVIHRFFKMWLRMGRMIPGYFREITNKYIDESGIAYSIGNAQLFSHPDPNKVASSRLTDLISGANTLTRLYAEEGLNAKRELTREAELMGITYEELCKIILSARSSTSIQIIHDNKELVKSTDDEDD